MEGVVDGGKCSHWSDGRLVSVLLPTQHSRYCSENHSNLVTGVHLNVRKRHG